MKKQETSVFSKFLKTKPTNKSGFTKANQRKKSEFLEIEPQNIKSFDQDIKFWIRFCETVKFVIITVVIKSFQNRIFLYLKEIMTKKEQIASFSPQLFIGGSRE